MTARSILAFLMVLAISSMSFSQSKFTKKGQVEVSGAFSFSNVTDVTDGKTNDGSTSYLSLSPTVQYFVSDGFEVGGSFELMNVSYSNDFSQTDYTFFFIPTYNFKTNIRFFPYVQGQIGYTMTSYSGIKNSGLAWAIESGVKVNFIGNGLIKFGFNYKQLTKNRENPNGRSGMNIFSAAIGIGLFF